MWPPESFSFSCSHRIGTYAPRIRPLFLFSRSAGVRPAKSCRQEAFDQWAVTQGCRMHQRRSPCPPNSIKAGPGDIAGLLREPRIAYSAELSVVTKEFAHSRSSLEEILDRHRGYVAKLRMLGHPSGHVFSAHLRSPSSEYRSALTELKGVGLVDHEEEAADEITQQHGELEARMVHAQNEEQPLLQLLTNRSPKSHDPGTPERQVALLRGEIERIESERYASGSRAPFPNVFFSLREERTSPPATSGAKLRKSTVTGLSHSSESMSTTRAFTPG